MAPMFPAILIGGPPHSGKSTLAYRVSDALQTQHVQHYVLRASPDGEGNWSNEAPQAVVAELRMRARSDWTPDFARQISRDIAQRHLPLLVDAGGKPSHEMNLIAAHCTHALLLAADPADLAPWRSLVARHGLALVADLHSELDTPQQISQDSPVLRGTISGLTRTRSSDGACFRALVARVARVCAYDAAELYRTHLAHTDIEMVIHLEQAIYPLTQRDQRTWQPEDLPALLSSLPPGEPLALYGRGPVWLYAALAAHAVPGRCELFDVRQGWVTPPPVCVAADPDSARLSWNIVNVDATTAHIQFTVPGSYLDYRAAADLPVPAVAPTQGVLLDGRLPNWLWAALARKYRTQPWIAIYQPQLGESVVVWSQHPTPQVGHRRSPTSPESGTA